jgi:hypothetical protein
MARAPRNREGCAGPEQHPPTHTHKYPERLSRKQRWKNDVEKGTGLGQ